MVSSHSPLLASPLDLRLEIELPVREGSRFHRPDSQANERDGCDRG